MRTVPALSLSVLLLPHVTPAQSGCTSQPPFPVPFPAVDNSSPVPSDPAAVITGFRTDATDRLGTWRFWWELNKDAWVWIARRDDPQAKAHDAEEIALLLSQVLRGADQRDLLASSTVALAKIGADGDEPLPDLLAANVSSTDRYVRTAAVLALGLCGRDDAAPRLLALLDDTADGRRLARRSKVEDRMRYYAAYGLGLLGRETGDPVLRSTICEALATVLERHAGKETDLELAAVNALRLLVPVGELHGRDRMTQWQCVDHLWSYFERRLGKSERLVQAQVPQAIAEILGRRGGADHDRYLRAFVELLERGRDHDAVLQSAALALGTMARPRGLHADDAAASEALYRYYVKGKDQQARKFCLISLGRIGGQHNRDLLLRSLERARHVERPWAALALGVLTREQYDCDDVLYLGNADATVGEALLRALQKARDPDSRSAIMIALGLTAWQGRRPGQVEAEIAALMDKSSPDDVLAGYASIALALLNAQARRPDIEELLEEARNRPWLFRQAATALAVLGEQDLPGKLEAAFGRDWNVSDQRLYAATLGAVGQRHDADDLVVMLASREAVDQTRAVVATALGDLYRRGAIPWSAQVAGNMNYAAALLALTETDAELLPIL